MVRQPQATAVPSGPCDDGSGGFCLGNPLLPPKWGSVYRIQKQQTLDLNQTSGLADSWARSASCHAHNHTLLSVLLWTLRTPAELCLSLKVTARPKCR